MESALPQERRQLEFSQDEMLQILAQFNQARGQQMRHEAVSIKLVRRDGGLRAELRDSAGRCVQLFTGSEIAAAILMICQKMRIPMARNAEKKLIPRGNRLVLDLTLNAPLPAFALSEPAIRTLMSS